MTRAAGRPAALPTPGYQAPQRLFLDDGQCLVRFFPERGGPPVDYDFAAFPITRELVVWLATAFAGATSPAGRRRTTSSALSAYGLLRRFAHHLASLNRPPAHPAQLRAAHLESFQMAGLGTPNLNRELPTLRSVLRFAPEGAGQDFLARLASKGLERNSTPAASYTTAEFDRITTTARSQLRRAAERIFAGRELLARWRAGQIDAEAEPRTWQHGELLDYVERRGDVPRRDTRQQPDHCVRPFGAGRLMADLHLTFSDIGAAGVLLLCLTGQNYSTIATATATHHRADGHTGTTATAVVDLVKPRRGRDRAHMPTAFSGSAPGGPGGSPHRQFDLHTPFGVYALLVDLAGPARAHIGTDLLLAFFCAKGVEKARGFRAGLPNSILASWSRGANLRADALGEDGLPVPLVVDSRRLRMSWLERHQQPVAHTERTLANEYLARNRGNLAEYQKVVADVLEEQLAGARAAQVMRVLTATDVAEARERPEAVARRHGLETATLKKLLAGELDTVLGGCTDHLATPHSPAGEPCRASFLLCLSCPCARATPAHLPVLIAVQDGLEARRQEMTPLRGAERFAGPVAQLADLLASFPTATIATTRTEITAEQRALVERFLTRGLDLT
ncbi:hypothetical protein SRB5_00440 [Streptomyces sp. RB5]|uniref:Uncharacterized protein n=1 Tax=Streptomyces smaragdinus TaxID=2585196 RepID=A0A7K0C915_9ACTN|nr:hypothetical protein [Streptomyces smaragdinus]MQY09940.1 hypothetical protein [Streptomyces smaragdinus]